MRKITLAQRRELITQGWQVKGAGLYEPTHAPKGTIFLIVSGYGLCRLTPPSGKPNVLPESITNPS